MDEREFWAFLKGRPKASQVSAVMEGSGEAGRYIQGHNLLPAGYDTLPEIEVAAMGCLLLSRETSIAAKEALLMILAHQPSETALTTLAKYCLNPDRPLAFYAQMALEECAMWNG